MAAASAADTVTASVVAAASAVRTRVDFDVRTFCAVQAARTVPMSAQLTLGAIRPKIRARLAASAHLEV